MSRVSSGGTDPFVKPQSTILGHPAGLFVLFVTEAAERFSYYGMRALLVLYMVNFFKWTQKDASFIYKWYTALVYLTPLLGGYLADRYLGNKKAIIIGGTLMAIGHFCMAFEQIEIFYTALVFLIIGNGFFKPNMSTQVGRLYPANDPRRDSAYTIFYMGINLGAFLSPLACGWLREHTRWGFHAGFTAAGIGMVIGLVVYLVFIKWVNEVPEGTEFAGEPKTKPAQGHGNATDDHYVSEAEAATTPSASPALSTAAPLLFSIVGFVGLAAFVLASLVQAAEYYGVGTGAAGSIVNGFGFDNFVAFGLGGGISALMGAWVISKVSLALRDRVVVIYLVGLFVVFFWAAFEQAGNAMNIYADKTTDRYLTQDAPEPPIYPVIVEEGAPAAAVARNVLNPVSTEWFQSINALGIITLAPLFAWMWVKLPRMGINLSIPAKVTIGVFMQGMAFALMIWAVKYENQPSSAALERLPEHVALDNENRVVFHDVPDLTDDDAFEAFATTAAGEPKEVINGGRIQFNAPAKSLEITGVLADTDKDRILRATTSREFLASVRELALKSEEAAKAAAGQPFTATVTLNETPAGFDIRYAGFPESKLRYNPDTRELATTVELADKDYKSILVAGADPVFRDAINQVYVASAKFKVSSMWLFWFYVLCTLGELCLSPVGLSMVSKLAPAKFATMLMGVWLLTSFFGNFVAGLAGESYGTIHPAKYFTYITIAMAGASLVCFIVVKKLKAMMHGVN